MNRNYGKIVNAQIVFAPDAVVVDGRQRINPRAESYARAADGPWLPIVDEPPATPPRDGYHWEAQGWAVEDGRNVRQYAEVADPPPPPRVFRRSWLAQWIRAAGKWEAFQSFLVTPPAADIDFLWDVCTEFDEDSLLWPAALAAIKAALQLTDEDADAMLAFGATGEAAQ